MVSQPGVFALYKPQHHGSSKGNTLKFWPVWGIEKAGFSVYKSSNISETRQDRTKVTIEVQ